MIDNRTQKIGGLAAAAILLPILLGLLFGAQAAYYLSAVVVLLTIVLGYCLLTTPPPRKKLDPWPEREPAREPEPKRRPSPRTVDLTSTLPSADTDFRFRIGGTVSWVPVKDATEHTDPDRLARDAVLARAETVTRTFAISHRDRAEEALGAALGASKPDGTNEIEASVSDMTLSVDEEDARKVRIIETVRKDREVFACQREHEVEVRAYLGNDAFATPGSTLVWWLSRNLGRFDESVDRLGTFTRVSAVAGGGDDPTPDARRGGGTSGMRIAGAGGSAPADHGSRVRALIEDLLPDADDDERGLIAGYLARSAGDNGYATLADRMRSAYGLQDLGDATSADGLPSASPTRGGANGDGTGDGVAAGDVTDGGEAAMSDGSGPGGGEEPTPDGNDR